MLELGHIVHSNAEQEFERLQSVTMVGAKQVF